MSNPLSLVQDTVAPTPADEAVHPLVALQAKRIETAHEGKRRAHETYVGLLQGERIAPVAKTDGTYVRDCVGQAKRRAVASLDLVTGNPGRKATDAEFLAWIGLSK